MFGLMGRGRGPYHKYCVKQWIESFKWPYGVENVFGTQISSSPDNYGKGDGWKFRPFVDIIAASDSELVVLSFRDGFRRRKDSEGIMGVFVFYTNATI